MLQTRQPRTRGRLSGPDLTPGERVTTTAHAQPRLLYPAGSLLAVTTSQGTWMTPPHRAIWLPGGGTDQHQVHGPAALRTLPFDPALVAGQRAEPAVVAVSGLL